MPMLNCYVDEATMKVLEDAAKRRGRNETPEQLAENAIANAALEERSIQQDRSR